MRTTLWIVAAGIGASLVVPAPAFATAGDIVVPAVRLAAEMVGLWVALVLLIQARRIRVEMAGSAFAEKMTFVVLATLCLAASAVVAWLQNFVVASVSSLVGFAAQLLVIAAMALLAVYFYRVRMTLRALFGSTASDDRVENELYSSGRVAPEGLQDETSETDASAVGE